MSVYFYRKERGRIIGSTYFKLILFSAVIQFFFTNSLMALLMFRSGDSFEYLLGVFLINLISFFFSLPGCALGGLLGILLLTSAEERKQGKIDSIAVKALFFVFIIFVLILCSIFWIINTQVASQRPKVATTGFTKIQPLTPSIIYNGTAFTAAFTNAQRNNITLTNVTLNETITGRQCSLDYIMIGPTKANNTLGLVVKPGGTIVISSTGCPPKEVGEMYDLVVFFEYNLSLDEVTEKYANIGHIKGQSEN
jgi:hypothetical protein